MLHYQQLIGDQLQGLLREVSGQYQHVCAVYLTGCIHVAMSGIWRLLRLWVSYTAWGKTMMLELQGVAEARRSCSGRRSARSTYSSDMHYLWGYCMGGVPPMAKLGACPVVV